MLQTSSDKTAIATELDAPMDAEGVAGVYNLRQSAEKRIVNNIPIYNYVLVAGTKSFTDDKYVSNPYSNGDIIYAAMKAFGKETVPIDIDFKVFDQTALDLTTAEANTWSILLTAFLPACVLVAGCVVYLRRRHL